MLVTFSSNWLIVVFFSEKQEDVKASEIIFVVRPCSKIESHHNVCFSTKNQNKFFYMQWKFPPSAYWDKTHVVTTLTSLDWTAIGFSLF